MDELAINIKLLMYPGKVTQASLPVQRQYSGKCRPHLRNHRQGCRCHFKVAKDYAPGEARKMTPYPGNGIAVNCGSKYNTYYAFPFAVFCAPAPRGGPVPS